MSLKEESLKFVKNDVGYSEFDDNLNRLLILVLTKAERINKKLLEERTKQIIKDGYRLYDENGLNGFELIDALQNKWCKE